ncbi:hypothetical protein [Mycolicibacterium sp. CBMA 226]|uniref:hypothetical protein n=1 Tax=Mycolicibacterium sp. CBMA 226 TaxID=2606611 RepID=UPI0012DDDFE8|nr:hypothetical protein [Mycolicibacterium sp. CBMA 226]MUL78971.1 hypothetical protein [Mycolicibacterium sp. CBMA 226]
MPGPDVSGRTRGLDAANTSLLPFASGSPDMRENHCRTDSSRVGIKCVGNVVFSALLRRSRVVDDVLHLTLNIGRIDFGERRRGGLQGPAFLQAIVEVVFALLSRIAVRVRIRRRSPRSFATSAALLFVTLKH